MKNEFRRYLQTLSDHAEDRPTEFALDTDLRGSAQKRLSDLESQEHIFDVQLDKQQVMRELHHRLRNLDSSEGAGAESSRRGIRVSGNEKSLVTEQGEPLTFGDVLTGLEWNRSFELDPATVPRALRKRYLIEEARQELQDLADWQIYFDEIHSGRVHESTKEAYWNLMEDRKNGTERHGMVLEKMVRTFLKKLSIDYGLEYEVHESDIFQDVVQKIDFIIERTGVEPHRRGARFQEGTGTDPQHIGIQFTINTDPEKISFKEDQIARSKGRLRQDDGIDDLVLATLFQDESSDLSHALNLWRTTGSSATPDTYLPLPVKEYIFKKMLGNLKGMDEEQINGQWLIAESMLKEHAAVREAARSQLPA